jgi:hypothetical protein
MQFNGARTLFTTPTAYWTARLNIYLAWFLA